MLDRKIAPDAHSIDSVEIITLDSYQLENQLPVHSMSAGSQELLKLEVILNAGSAHHANPLVPSFTNAMLQEGTATRTALQIASDVDDYGAFLELDHDKDFASVSLYTLNKHLKKTLPVIKDILLNPVFPENEWNIFRANRLQKYKVNQGKVSFLAGKKFQEIIFAGTAYGTAFGEAEYLSIQTKDLKEYWEKYYTPGSLNFLLCGHIDDLVKEEIATNFGELAVKQQNFIKNLPFPKPIETIERVQFIEKEDAIQSAIRIGRRLFTKSHEDFYGMKVLTTILGGYFGSRLMSNIREDKGYTYGIGAGVASYKNEGYFYISTEVGADVCKAALAEIYKEIEILQQDLIPEQELQLVKNYLLGNLLKSFDGPFERMERFKSTRLYGLDLGFYTRYTAAIKAITSEQLRSLANVWLQKDDLVELLVGKR
jgi:predicted Zn-dependent peptidase